MVSAPGQNASTRSARPAGSAQDEAVEGLPGADQHRRRHVRPRPLASSSALTADGVERVGADPVHGVGGQHHQLAALDRVHRGVDPRSRSAGGTDSRRASRRASLPGGGPVRRGGGEPGTAGQVAVVLDVGEAPVRGEQRRHRSPVRVVVLDRHVPAGREQAGRAATTARTTASPSGPPKTAPGGSCSATSGATGLPAGHVRRVAEHQVHRGRPGRPAGPGRPRRRVHSDRRIARGGPSTLRRSHAARPGRALHGVHRGVGASLATASAIAPEPAHRSTTTAPATRSRAAPTPPAARSPAGARTPPDRPPARGTGTRAVPVRCCSGTAARRAGDQRPVAVEPRRGEVGVSASRPRGTPSTCAASNSASTRGEATPAAASIRRLEMTGRGDRSRQAAAAAPHRLPDASLPRTAPDRVRG